MTSQEAKFYQSCPRCNAGYVYSSVNIDTEGRIRCQNCGRHLIPGEESPIDDNKERIEESSTPRSITLLIVFILIFLLLYLMTVELDDMMYGSPQDGLLYIENIFSLEL